MQSEVRATFKEHPYSCSIMLVSGIFDFHDIVKHLMILFINGFALLLEEALMYKYL